MSGPRFPNAPGRNVPAAIRAMIYERSAHTCFYCGTGPPLTVDHVVPWSQGGSNHPMNLVASCNLCNVIAGERLFRDITDKMAYVLERRGQLGVPT